jgi:hypothetical protein
MKMRITIEGPQGVGKTRVAQELSFIIRRAGHFCHIVQETDRKIPEGMDVLIYEKTTNFEEACENKIYNKNDPWEAISDIFKQLTTCRQSIEEIKAHNEDNPLIKELFYRIEKLENPSETLNDNLDKSLKDYILTEAQKLDTDLRLAALRHVEIGSTNFTDEAEKIYQWLKGSSNEEGKKD